MNDLSKSEEEIYQQRKQKLEEIAKADSSSLPHSFSITTSLKQIRDKFNHLDKNNDIIIIFSANKMFYCQHTII